MTMSGLEMLTTLTISAKSAYATGTRLRTMGVISSMVCSEKSCAMMAVEDALMVRAISRITPGIVACRLTLVMSTSSGGLRCAVTAAVTWANSACPITVILKIKDGESVASMETVALYPISCGCTAARRVERRKRVNRIRTSP